MQFKYLSCSKLSCSLDGPVSTLVAPRAEWSQRLEEVSGSAPQDLQDHNDELQAALESLQAQLPQSWRSRPNAQPNGQLFPRHGQAGKSPVPGGGSGVHLLGVAGAGGNEHLHTLQHRLLSSLGSAAAGGPASQHLRA